MKSINNVDDIKYGKSYYMNWDNSLYIFAQEEESGPLCYYIHVKEGYDNSFANGGNHKNSVGNRNNKMTREATWEEKAWLDACIKAGKYVDNPKEVMYEIY